MAVDSYEYTALPDAITVEKVEPKSTAMVNGRLLDTRSAEVLGKVYEHKPHFHEWLRVAAQIRHPWKPTRSCARVYVPGRARCRA